MSRGSIRRRGRNSWELKFDVGTDAGGKRKTRYVTVRGRRQDAQKELTRLLAEADAGTLPEPSKMTVREYIVAWLGVSPNDDEPFPPPSPGLSPKTAERYRQLAEQQIYPHIGGIVMQKLRPFKVAEWHETLLATGGITGKPLSARTVGHAHRVLHRALARAVQNEVLGRNVASAVKPPKVEDEEVEIFEADEVVSVLAKLAGHELGTIANAALASGARRGELLALTWERLNVEAATMSIKRTLEQTGAGLRFKPPKTKRGFREITLPPSAVAVLREHRRRQLELRLQLGLGRPDSDALVFCRADGSPIPPNDLSRDWARVCKALELPRRSFHALRHTHASALISAGHDVVAISRRLGHKSPSTTLRIYAHLFDKVRKDAAAADAIEAAMRGQ